jgi:hypothetical protein
MKLTNSLELDKVEDRLPPIVSSKKELANLLSNSKTAGGPMFLVHLKSAVNRMETNSADICDQSSH